MMAIAIKTRPRSAAMPEGFLPFARAAGAPLASPSGPSGGRIGRYDAGGSAGAAPRAGAQA